MGATCTLPPAGSRLGGENVAGRRFKLTRLIAVSGSSFHHRGNPALKILGRQGTVKRIDEGRSSVYPILEVRRGFALTRDSNQAFTNRIQLANGRPARIVTEAAKARERREEARCDQKLHVATRYFYFDRVNC